MKDTTFIVETGTIWYSCFNDNSDITITYEINSDNPVNLLFTPTKQDAEGIISTNVTSINTYPSCYVPNALSTKGQCIISGKGCMVLENSKETDARVNLKSKEVVINA
ncbi:MAG: hypothetical protein WCI72_04535 [archaeon]